MNWAAMALHEQTCNQQVELNQRACQFSQTVEQRKGDRVLRKMQQKLSALERRAIDDEEVENNNKEAQNAEV